MTRNDLNRTLRSILPIGIYATIKESALPGQVDIELKHRLTSDALLLKVLTALHNHEITIEDAALEVLLLTASGGK